MKKKKFFQFSLLVFIVISIFQLILYAETYDLSSPDSWYFLGTVDKYQKGFLLGDSDGYTQGDSCFYKWYNQNYDYDVAISKVGFKAPFTFEFETAVDPTDYGFNYIEIVCLSDKLIDETPLLQCSNTTPIKWSSVGSIYYGKRWEEGDKVCAGVGIPSREGYKCIDEKERFNKVKIIMDEDHNAKIYVNGNEIYSGNFGKCDAHNGYMVIYMQSFDSQIDFLNGNIEANDIKSIKDILFTGAENSSSENNDEYDKGYNDGYKAGIEYCKNHPEECGISCKEEQTSSYASCEATYNFFENKLHIPCLRMDKSYWLDLKLINNNPVQLELSGFGENE